jgi:hypothetical protein
MENTDRPPTAQFSIKDNRRLIFQSRPISVTIKTGTPAAFRFEGFEVVEALKSQKQEGKDKTDQSYVVLFTTRVETEEDINKAFSDFRVIKSAIDVTWQFVFGFAYDGGVRNDTTSPAIVGWADNRQKVLANLQTPKPILHIEFQSFPVLQLDDWPLKRILRVISYYKEADETHKFLMDLHAKTLSMENIEIRLTLLGKLADLCDTLLPGDTRKEKIESIPGVFRNRLVFDSEVFRIANTRSLTRHAANKSSKQLHPIMNSGEIEDFQSDIDTLVRYLVFQKVQMQPCFYEGWRFPANCAVRWSGRIGKERSRQRDAKKQNTAE